MALEEKSLHEVDPRETAGREAISRFAAQFRAAAYMSLTILQNGEIDCVFCDYHDDYVVRRKNGSLFLYDFYQVKTKGNPRYQWTQPDVYSIPRRGQADFKEISESFAGKLLIHTIRFGKSCNAVIFQTNIQFNEHAFEISEALKNGDISQKFAKVLFEKFREIFPEAATLSEAEIHACLAKFKVVSGCSISDPEGLNFLALAKDAVYRYSEVELSYQEFVEIAEKLLSLVQAKSLKKINEITETELIENAGITIYDLLDILAISRAGYESLVNGGDLTALKTASILHRKLKEAGAQDEMIDYLCRQKVLWDEWLRTKRHILAEFNVNFLIANLHDRAISWISSGGKLQDLFESAETYASTNTTASQLGLTKELVIGGILADITRGQK